MKRKYRICLLVFGMSLIIIGLTIYFIIPVIVHQKMNEMLPLRNGTLVYQQCRNTTVPAFIQFWYFSVVNPVEVINGDKPNMVQIGPYTYREPRIKYNIEFNDNGTVSYLQKRIYHFERDKSVGDETDVFTTVNIPLIVLGDKVKNFPRAFKKIIGVFFKEYEKNGLFFKTSVRNITWGYIDLLLELGAEFCRRFKWVCESVHFELDPKIGLFYGRNDTADEIYTVDSGSVNLDNFLAIVRWNGSDKLTIWNGKYANMINGTDGAMFAPFANKSSRIYAFQSDVCTSVYATYVGVDVIRGIPSYNYEALDSLFANHTENPDNYGFCVDGYCLDSGLINLTKCVPLAPVVMSLPHFLNAAEQYRDSVDRLHPSGDLKTMLKLEPTTGLPLDLQKKLQINLAMQPVQDFMDMDKVPNLILPIMWLNESALISDQLAGTIRQMLIVPVKIGEWASLATITAGAFVILIAAGVFIKDARYHLSGGYVKIN